MKQFSCYFYVISVLITLSCLLLANTSKADLINETVLSKGTVLTVQADWATIDITNVGKYKRKYTWDGQSIVVDLIPRKKRWYGSLGLYHPQVRPPHQGVVHMVVEEGQQHFRTMDEAIIWLERFGEKPIYSDDGLVISTYLRDKNSKRKFIGIDIWQIFVGGKTLSSYQEKGATEKSVETAKEYMNDNQFETYKRINLRKHYLGGQKPTKLPGSQNSRITIK